MNKTQEYTEAKAKMEEAITALFAAKRQMETVIGADQSFDETLGWTEANFRAHIDSICRTRFWDNLLDEARPEALNDAYKWVIEKNRDMSLVSEFRKLFCEEA